MTDRKDISTIDLGLPLEADVLSQFFDDDFIPIDYINALCNTSLQQSQQPSQMANKSIQMNSASSMKLLYQRCSALNLHFNEYTNELSKRFDQSYESLITSSSQIISYDSRLDSALSAGNGENSNDSASESKLITRLQYYVSTLNSSMLSLIDEINDTKMSLETINPTLQKKGEDQDQDQNNKVLKDLKDLKQLEKNIQSVKNSINLLKSLISNSQNQQNDETNNKISVTELQNSLNVLRNLMNDQISKELELINRCKKNSTDFVKNEKLLKILNDMIGLQPLFKTFTQFQSIYSSFADHLRIKRDEYLAQFN